MRDADPPPESVTLVQNIYDCLDASLRVENKLTSREIGRFFPPHGRDPADPSRNEKRLIYKLSRLLYQEGRNLLPEQAFHFPPDSLQAGAKLIPQIAGLYDQGTPGKRPYHEVMQEGKLCVPQNFTERIMAAFGNPAQGGRLDWPELKTHPAFYAKLIGTLADFDREMGYDPPSHNILYKAVYDPDVADKAITEAHQKYRKVNSIGAPAKPMVVYFGGMISPSEQEEFINRAMRRIKRSLNPGLIPTDQYDIYVTTYNNRASLRKIQYILEYMQDPEHFASPMAREVVKTRLKPLYAQEDSNGHWQRLDTEAMMHNMSLVMFMGYSYGTNFIQEVRNAMADDMAALGYSPKEIRNGLQAVAAINVGPATPVIDKSARGNFTQLFAAADGDTATKHKSNIHELVAADPHPHLKQYSMEGDEGLATVVAMGMDVPARLPSFKTSSLFRRGELGAKAGLEVYTLDATVTQNNESRHHIESFLRSTRVRRDDNTLTIAINPVSETVREFMQQQMKASIAVAKGEHPMRNAQKILSGVAQEHLNPEAISAQVARTEAINRKLAQEARERDLPSARRHR